MLTCRWTSFSTFVLGCPHYILRMTDPDRGISSLSEGKKQKIKSPGQLMSEERKNKRDKLTDSPLILTENDHFSRKIESGFKHVGGKNKRKAEMASFFSCRTQFQLIGGLVIRRI